MKSSIGFLLLSAKSISIVAFSSTFSSRGISNRVKNCWSSWPVKGENIRPIIARNLSSSSEKYPSLSRIKSSLLFASLPVEEIIEIVEHDGIPSSSDEDSKDSKRSAFFAKSLVTHLQIDVSKRPFPIAP